MRLLGACSGLECYRLAAEARHMANAAMSPLERADFLAVEERWLSLARGLGLWSGTGGQGTGMKSTRKRVDPRDRVAQHG
jgi:hypothetical protein